MANINLSTLVGFTTNYCDEIIGRDRLGEATDVYTELNTVYRKGLRAYAKKVSVIMYLKGEYSADRHGAGAFREAEKRASFDVQKETQEAVNMFREARKKMCWLNSCCRKLTGNYFIEGRLDSDEYSEVNEAIVVAFIKAIHEWVAE